MKTIFIYDQCGERPLSFFVKEGDYTYLDGTYINQSGSDENEQADMDAASDELQELIPAGTDNLLEMFPLDVVAECIQNKERCFVITVGFLP